MLLNHECYWNNLSWYVLRWLSYRYRQRGHIVSSLKKFYVTFAKTKAIVLHCANPKSVDLRSLPWQDDPLCNYHYLNIQILITIPSCLHTPQAVLVNQITPYYILTKNNTFLVFITSTIFLLFHFVNSVLSGYVCLYKGTDLFQCSIYIYIYLCMYVILLKANCWKSIRGKELARTKKKAARRSFQLRPIRRRGLD